MSKRASPPPTVDVVFPCLDEGAALPGLLARVPANYRVIVVDNGSKDDTASVARSLGARVIEEPHRGYGSAVHAGIAAATADIVAVMDGDGSLDPGALIQLVAEVAAGRTDLALGRRRPTSSASWPWHARAGNGLLARYLRARTPLRVTDLGPVRVAHRLALLDLEVQDRRCGYPVETLLRAAHDSWRITEYDMAYSPRAAGTRSKVSGSARGTAIALHDIARVISRHRASARPPIDTNSTRVPR